MQQDLRWLLSHVVILHHLWVILVMLCNNEDYNIRSKLCLMNVLNVLTVCMPSCVLVCHSGSLGSSLVPRTMDQRVHVPSSCRAC